MALLSLEFFNNTIQEYLIFLGILFGLIIVFVIFKSIIVHRLKKVAGLTKTEYDDALIKIIQKISWLFYFILALFVASKYLVLGDLYSKIIYYIFVIILVWQIIKSIQVGLDFLIEQYIIKKNKENDDDEEDGPDVHKIAMFTKLIKIIIWIVGGLLIVSNLGFNITSLIAGLGVGGIAIALAAQNILEDIFASFSIYLDQPFKIGDYIVVGDKMGTVKKIGIKTSRITSLQGEEIIISNKELTNAHIQNYKKMEERRINFSLGITYETSNDKLKKIPALVEKAVNSVKDCRFERAVWKSFGDYSLGFDIVFYYPNNDYTEYLLAQEQINLLIKDFFEKEGIDFAYPSQTIFLNK